VKYFTRHFGDRSGRRCDHDERNVVVVLVADDDVGRTGRVLDSGIIVDTGDGPSDATQRQSNR
jgi:hypothetical protein